MFSFIHWDGSPLPLPHKINKGLNTKEENMTTWFLYVSFSFQFFPSFPFLSFPFLSFPFLFLSFPSFPFPFLSFPFLSFHLISPPFFLAEEGGGRTSRALLDPRLCLWIWNGTWRYVVRQIEEITSPKWNHKGVKKKKKKKKQKPWLMIQVTNLWMILPVLLNVYHHSFSGSESVITYTKATVLTSSSKRVVTSSIS